MTFGYIGYIWALFGCGGLGLVVLMSTAFLYTMSGRRGNGSRYRVRVLWTRAQDQKINESGQN
ncbi:MAG: hypothetical protein RMJ84_04055 [Sandaracinaceae bacterium]|nr:hypothetical protein [Sandaracinaceae bacterium]